MATYAENLTTARDQMAAQLASITASPKPTYSENGRTMSWVEYQKFLLDGLKEIEARIQSAAGPWEVQSRGIT